MNLSSKDVDPQSSTVNSSNKSSGPETPNAFVSYYFTIRSYIFIFSFLIIKADNECAK